MKNVNRGKSHLSKTSNFSNFYLIYKNVIYHIHYISYTLKNGIIPISFCTLYHVKAGSEF